MGNYESKVLPRLEEVRYLKRNGVADKDIAAALGVGYSTFRRYAKEHPDLRGALAASALAANARVVNALFLSATGHTVMLKKSVKVREKGGGEHLEEGQEETYIPPNPQSMVFWLTNKLPEEWKRNRAVEKMAEDGEFGKVLLKYLDACKGEEL